MTGVTDDELDAMIAAVRDVASREINPRFRALDDGDIDEKSSAEDLVTVADKASEEALTKAFRKIMPDADVIGEESVAADKSILGRVGDSGRTIVIDPIDGTWNYANGVAVYGVIIAVVEDDQTVMGLIYDPVGDDWVVARAGQGATFQRPGQPARQLSASRNEGPVDESFGFVGLYLFDKPQQEMITRTLHLFKRTANLRCSAHEYRMLAEGRTDFCLNGMLNPWDHAAGVLIYREAGGVARLIDGTEYRPTMTDGLLLTAGTERLWDELADTWSALRG